MVREPKNRESGTSVASQRRVVALLVALAMAALSCGGGDEPSSSVASLADVEVAETSELDPEPEASELAEAASVDGDPTDTSEAAGDTATADEPASSETEVDPPTEDATGEMSSDESASDAEADEEPAERTDEEMALDFVACMRAQGIEMSDPTVDADGNVQLLGPGGIQQLSDPDFQDAAPNCVDLIETATFFTEAPDLTDIEDRLLEFAQCLRSEGLDVTDPDMSNLTGGPAAIFGANFDPQDPANAGAIAACQQFLPNAGGN